MNFVTEENLQESIINSLVKEYKLNKDSEEAVRKAIKEMGPELNRSCSELISSLSSDSKNEEKESKIQEFINNMIPFIKKSYEKMNLTEE